MNVRNTNKILLHRVSPKFLGYFLQRTNHMLLFLNKYATQLWQYYPSIYVYMFLYFLYVNFCELNKALVQLCGISWANEAASWAHASRAFKNSLAVPCRQRPNDRRFASFSFSFPTCMPPNCYAAANQFGWHYWRARGWSSVAKRELPLPFGAAETARNSPGRVSARQGRLFFLPFDSFLPSLREKSLFAANLF